LRYRQLNQEGDRAVIWSELEMEAKPGKAPLASRGGVFPVIRAGAFARLIFIGNVVHGGFGVADCPTRVIETGLSRRGVRCNANPPAFVEHQRRPEAGSVKNR
jgi:hypothetical protein